MRLSSVRDPLVGLAPTGSPLNTQGMASTPAGKKPAPKTPKPAASVKKRAGVVAPVVEKPKPKAPNADQIKVKLCEALSEGVPLREVCREAGMPAWRTVYDWMDADASFAAAIARARDIGADAIAADSLRIVDAAPERNAMGNIDPAAVAHAKLRAEHRLKLLAKWNPKKYGDKVETTLTGANGGPIEMQTRELSDAERAVRLSRSLNDNPAALAALMAAIVKKAGQ